MLSKRHGPVVSTRPSCNSLLRPAIMTEAFCGNAQFLPTNAGIVLFVKPRLLLSTFSPFSFYYDPNLST
jgi:hypothetical protein